ncbi:MULTISPECIES: HNH endonuclease [Pseudomonas]|uniref:HNH endonuclease n=1 Tax=Pseudomonas TaxID=286 RepID=UPI001183D969|nr:MULTISPECIES: HNH endonuclease [Pseudomonas]QEO76767.1 hypothetical protein ELZ14_04095 [Pseudomonas brassicacearum]
MTDYCIYLDGPSTDLSKEHIIPMSLGGLDSFCIQADRKFNNEVGSKVDGAVANDFLMLFNRDKANAKGHSGAQPQPIARRATLIDGSPVQVTFSKNGLQIYDLKQRRYLGKGERRGGQVKIDGLKLDLNADIKFVAKVALAAGFYAYGDLFRKGVMHSEPRKIVTANSLMDIRPDVRLYTRFQGDQELPDPGDFQMFKMIVELSGCSCVLIIPGKNCFGVVVGVLGEFMGMINIPADTIGFPNEGDYILGHCIFLQSGKVKRMSFRHVALKLSDYLEGKNENVTTELELQIP